MFQVGSYAHRGLSELVLTGETHTLEQELANEQRNKGSVDLRFFMTDTWWRQAIRVNRDYHQISLINKYVDENIESADSFIVSFCFCIYS
ncbi:unnamed protein product [Rotaria magnacalcarata]|nr:unnamed protein product [Rotaria magnacalcarata]